MTEKNEIPTRSKAEEALRNHHHLSKRKRKKLDRPYAGTSPEEIRASQIASSEKARTEKARIIEKEAAAA